jgi:hypothetical protein
MDPLKRCNHHVHGNHHHDINRTHIRIPDSNTSLNLLTWGHSSFVLRMIGEPIHHTRETPSSHKEHLDGGTTKGADNNPLLFVHTGSSKLKFQFRSDLDYFFCLGAW